MATITEDQKALCLMAQLYASLGDDYQDPTAYNRVLSQIEDLEFEIVLNHFSDGDFGANTALHIANHQNHLESFKKLLERGADLTIVNQQGMTVVHQAFDKSYARYIKGKPVRPSINDPFIETALIHQVNMRIMDNSIAPNGLTHFHIACATNNLRAVTFYMVSQLDQKINGSSITLDQAVHSDSQLFPGYTALHFASEFGAVQSVEMLVRSFHADVRVKDARAMTPMHLAIKRRFELVDLLNDYNMDMQLRNNERIIQLLFRHCDDYDDNVGLTTLHAACTLKDTSIVEQLLQLEFSDVNRVIDFSSSIWPGYGPLHFAAHFNVDTVKLLVQSGAELTMKDTNGVTPFDLCLERYTIEDIFDIASLVPAWSDIVFSDKTMKLFDSLLVADRLEGVLEKVGNKQIPTDSPLWPGYTFLHLVVQFYSRPCHVYHRGNEYIQRSVESQLNACLQGGCELSNQDTSGRTAIHLAFRQNKLQIVDYLLKQCPLNIANLIDDEGLSLLHIACSASNRELVLQLSSNEADVNLAYNGKSLDSMKSGWTPLHAAVVSENLYITMVLLQYGADANIRDASGMTPIHWSLKNGVSNDDNDVADLLFMFCKIRNVTLRDSQLNHLHVACHIGNTFAAAELLKQGSSINGAVTRDHEILDDELSCYASYTPMHFAIARNNIDIVNLLLERKDDIVALNRWIGIEPLYDSLQCIRKNDCVDILLLMLDENVGLQHWMRNDTRLTMLHLACYQVDAQKILKIITSDEYRLDVNAQVRADSPVWPGFTPLHVLMTAGATSSQFKVALRSILMVNCDVDVTLTDNNGNTPVHLIMKLWHHFSDPEDVRMLLRAQKDYSINPVNDQGISHFHLACKANDYVVVERFLKQGIVDVNAPIDYFDYKLTFQTPLHIALYSSRDRQLFWSVLSIDSQVKTIALLLEYGADVHVQDENGLAPIHIAARWGPSRELLLNRLVRANADINARSLNGTTALEIVAKSDWVMTQAEFASFVDNGFFFNATNLVTKETLLATIVSSRTNTPNCLMLLKELTSDPSLTKTDEMGRTPIHNIVRNYLPTLEDHQYAQFISNFMEMGYDVDAVDTFGKTALHEATILRNTAAAAGLIMVGADINIADGKGYTAFDYAFRSCYFCEEQQLESHGNTHVVLRQIFAQQAVKMQLCGLDTGKIKYLSKYSLKSVFQANSEFVRKVSQELEETKWVKIGLLDYWTLRDFMSETGAVASWPFMVSEPKRNAVDEIFASIDYTLFPMIGSLIKLQYRKVLERLEILQESSYSLKIVFGKRNGFNMPEVCCQMIIRFLSNREMKHLILAAS